MTHLKEEKNLVALEWAPNGYYLFEHAHGDLAKMLGPKWKVSIN